MAESLDLCSFPGSVAPISIEYTITATGLGKTLKKKSFKTQSEQWFQDLRPPLLAIEWRKLLQGKGYSPKFLLFVKNTYRWAQRGEKP